MVIKYRDAVRYAETSPLLKLDKKFTGLAELLYPRTPSGIILEFNSGDNLIRYKLDIEIEGEIRMALMQERLYVLNGSFYFTEPIKIVVFYGMIIVFSRISIPRIEHLGL